MLQIVSELHFPLQSLSKPMIVFEECSKVDQVAISREDGVLLLDLALIFGIFNADLNSTLTTVFELATKFRLLIVTEISI